MSETATGNRAGEYVGVDRLDRWLRELESWTESRGAGEPEPDSRVEERYGDDRGARGSAERRSTDPDPGSDAASGLTRAEVQSLFTWACP